MTGRPHLAFTAAVATLCAATGLLDVFASADWLMPVTGGIAVVAIVSELARRTRVAAAIGPLLAAGAVLLYITWLYSRDLAYARFIPTGSSLQHLGDLARSGFTDVRSLATPVPTHRGLVLLAVVGVAAVALVVDLVAVTMRHAAVAGLPLLAMFALCTSVSRHGVGWLPFVLGAAGYLWLLLTDSKDRVGRWGRTLGTTEPARPSWSDPEAASSPLSILGRRAGALAIVIGVVVPLLIPGLHGGLPKHGGDGTGTGNGSSRVVTLNPIVSVVQNLLLSPNATPVLRMSSSDPEPSYLRLTALDRFDGTTFSPSDLTAPSGSTVRNGIKAPQVTGTAVTTRVAVGDLSVHWLPVPVQAQRVDVKGDWHYDRPSNTIFSARSTTKSLTFTVSSINEDPAAADLSTAPAVDPSQYATYLAVPQVQPEVRTLAEQITGKAKSPFDKALAIQNYLDSPPFSYSTNVTPGDSANALARFLFVTKTGFCQQYSAAMAVLARLVGIPSRVAVGFTRGERQSDGTWLVTTHDAHAWPELFFASFGWVAFEPTPRGDGQTVRPAYTQPSTSPSSSDTVKAGQQVPAPHPSTLRDQLNRLLQDAEAPTRPVTPPVRPHHSHAWWWALVVLAALCVVPSTVRVVSRRRRRLLMHDPSQRAAAAWAELRAVAIDAGARWSDAVTPRTAGRLITTDYAVDDAAMTALGRLVAAEERARYAPEPASAATDGAELWQSVTKVRRALFAERSVAARVGSVLMPRSTTLVLSGWAGRIADVLDVLDAAVARVRRTLRRVPQPG